MEFKDRLAKLRKIKGMTQTNLAEEVGVTIRSIQNYELGSRTPKTEIIDKIAEVLNVDRNALFSDEEYFIIEAKEIGGTRGKAAAERLIRNANALFSGGDISDEDKVNVMNALTEAFNQANVINKKYTPKKYIKNAEEKTE